jgi:hypothetical protein
MCAPLPTEGITLKQRCLCACQGFSGITIHQHGGTKAARVNPADPFVATCAQTVEEVSGKRMRIVPLRVGAAAAGRETSSTPQPASAVDIIPNLVACFVQQMAPPLPVGRLAVRPALLSASAPPTILTFLVTTHRASAHLSSCARRVRHPSSKTADQRISGRTVSFYLHTFLRGRAPDPDQRLQRLVL